MISESLILSDTYTVFFVVFFFFPENKDNENLALYKRLMFVVEIFPDMSYASRRLWKVPVTSGKILVGPSWVCCDFGHVLLQRKTSVNIVNNFYVAH